MLRLEAIAKSFDGEQVVSDVTLNVGAGELFALLGPSGCGKSTLLRIIGGLTTPDAGRVLIDDVDMTRYPPWARPVNMMFQTYALFPHLSVFDNIAYGLRREKIRGSLLQQRVNEMLSLTRMTAFARRRPGQLSGGQRQRVALARALAKRPKVLLLDEPLSALDRKLREQTQIELMDIQDRLGTTFVVVTHDQAEAMILATGMSVMNNGRLLQTGKPIDLYEHPRQRFVADFLGTINLFTARFAYCQDQLTLLRDVDSQILLAIDKKYDFKPRQEVTLAVRPEKLTLCPANEAAPRPYNQCSGIIRSRIYTGGRTSYQVKLDSGAIIQVEDSNRHRTARPGLDWDDQVTVAFSPDCLVVLED